MTKTKEKKNPRWARIVVIDYRGKEMSSCSVAPAVQVLKAFQEQTVAMSKAIDSRDLSRCVVRALDTICRGLDNARLHERYDPEGDELNTGEY